jgi:integrase/recombinase XerD
MSEKPINDLRRRMLEDMAVRKFGEKTRHDYIRHVEAFARFLGRSPDTAAAEDVRRFQVHLTESGVQPPTLNSSASALRFFFGAAPSSAAIWPACTTRGSCLACSRPRRLADFWKRRPAPASSTRRL